MDHIYQIPLIPQDLRQEENIIQIADVLDHLNSVVDDIFTKLNVRIENNMKRTKVIRRRINDCAYKVDRLEGIKRATKVLCDAKYPSMDCHNHVEAVFKGDYKGNILRTRRDMKVKPTVYSERELQDKLEFYHVKMSSEDPVQTILEKTLPRSKDSPPTELKAVGSLLIYGTEDLIYGSRVDFGGSVNVPTAKEVTEKGLPSPLHEPPTTVLTNELRNTSQHLYLYSPNMEEVPIMDMPQDLPHLSGIAGDMRFYLESDNNIAPSARIQSPPSIQAFNENTVVSAEKPTENQKQPTVLAETSVAVTEDVAIKSVTSLSQSISAPPLPPPPPPPPPPPSAQRTEETDSAVVRKSSSTPKTAPSTKPPVSQDSRANLMEAIRNAGGSQKARLRSTTAVSTPKSNDVRNKGVGGGDLMADLHAKLSMRRKGISGTRQGVAEGSILAALSAIIPPPPEAEAQSNSELSSAEEDWE